MDDVKKYILLKYKKHKSINKLFNKKKNRRSRFYTLKIMVFMEEII
jgi:rRNA pseudouridine-1189 N-methylase Emg1 (Nep1/Mra1 family)